MTDGFHCIIPRGFRSKPDRDNRFLSGLLFSAPDKFGQSEKREGERVETVELLDFTGG